MSRKYRNKFQQKTLLNIINEAKTLYDRKLFTDVTLQCEGQEFAAHKVILIANSPYFKEYFSQNGNIENVAIDFMTSEVLQIILEYFYTGRIIVDKQTLRLLKSILEVSTILQIPLLSNYCLELILNKKLSDLSLSDWKVIEKLNSKIIFEIYLQIIIKKLNLLNTTQSFLQLSVNQMYVLFQCPAVAECDQNIVFQSILNWIKYDSDERKEQLTQFLESFVNWQRLNTDLLLELQNEPLLTDNMYFLKSYFKLMYHEKNVKTVNVRKKLFVDLKGTEVKVQYPSNIKICKTVIQNNPKILYVQNVATHLKNPTFPFLEETKFFIYGSKDVVTREIIIYLYDYGKNKLDRMVTHPLLNREKAAVLFHDGSIYTFGYRVLDKGIASRSVFSCNLEMKEWIKKNLMLNFKYQSVAVELNGYIYVVGGIARNGYLKCVEHYNPVTDQWKSVADLPDVNEDTVPVVAVNDCLYIVIKAKLYKYNPEDNKWDSVDIELDKCIEGEVCISGGNDKIFIIEKKAPTSVWIYDCKENTIDEDIIQVTILKCEGMLNLENHGNLQFLIRGNEKWFIYRPSQLWAPFDPKKQKDFHISMLTLIHS